MPLPAIAASGVRVSYRTSADETVTAVDKLDLSIANGEFVAIIGPSGCGKSTFVRAVADLLPKGALVGTLSVHGMTPAEARRNHKYAIVFQDPVLLPWRSVLANVELPRELLPTRTTRDPSDLLELVGLKGFEKALPRECSGGMRSRVAIARALMVDPAVLLMDEPFAAVDEMTREHLNVQLQYIWLATGPAVVFVTHSIVEATFLADRVVVMSNGPCCVRGIVDITFPRPRDLEIRRSVEFFKKTNEVRDLLETSVRTSVGVRAHEDSGR